MITKISTLAIVHRDGKVLLGKKKRDFGVGKWNGFGGKVKEGESLGEAFKREIWEEVGIVPKEFTKIGHNTFVYQGKDEIWEVHIYKVTDFEGEIQESDEMEPKWFLESEIPLEEMWPDDEFWMPKFLSNENFRGKFIFENFDRIIEYSFEKVK